MKGEILEDARGAQFAVAAVRKLGVDARQLSGTRGAQVVEQHLADHAIDSDIGADAECQGRDCRGGESGRAAEESKGRHRGILDR